MKSFAALLIEKRMRIIYATTALTLTLSAPALAQLENQTGIADPGRAEQQIQEEMFIPQVSPDIDIRQMELVGAPPGAEKIVFKFGGLRVDGASVYSESKLAPLYRDKIGQTISLADVYAIANDMTLKYRNDGYILTQVVVPPQTIENGIARVQVVEGYVDKIVVQPGEGEGDYAVGDIKEYAAQIKSSGPVNVRSLERELLIINDLPGVKARSILSPSKTTPGAADLLIIVERKPYDAMLSIDNYGSRYLGPSQMGAAGTLNSALGLNEAISAQVVAAPIQSWRENELWYASLGYEMPVGPYGTKVAVLGSITDTAPGFDLEEFEVQGRSDLVQIKATHPFIRARSHNLYGRLLFDRRNVRSENNVEETRKDNLRVLRAGMRYEFLDQILGVGFNVVDLEVSKGLDILGASNEGDTNLTRDLGDPQFSKAELEIQRLQRITDSVNLLVEGRGQLSNDALLSSEEFAIGGFSSGRGYDPSEIVGDDGISGRLELQWKNPGNLQTNVPYVDKYQLFSFYDIGKVWNDDNTTSDRDESLASVGAGVRVNFQSGVNGGMAVAFPLTREVQTRDDRDTKFYFNLNKQF
jgi:hemolysin activation/secretion protein